MSRLICNLPAINLWVRKEYLRDHEDGHGEFVKGVWISCKSLPGRAFYFETYLPEYGAMFDKLPISAFVSEPKTPNPDLPLYNLQFWNCMDYNVTCIQKQFIGSMSYAGGGSLKPVPEGNKGKGLSKLPTEVRNKMGFMKKGGKVMKMRGGGMASRGISFRMR